MADAQSGVQSIRRHAFLNRHRVVVAIPLVLAALTASFAGGLGFKRALDRDASIRGVSSFARARYDGTTFAINGLEAADRFPQILTLRTGDDWTGRFKWVPPGEKTCGARYFVAMDDQGAVAFDAPVEIARRLPEATIYDFGVAMPCPAGIPLTPAS